jgi:hypothetical protein
LIEVGQPPALTALVSACFEQLIDERLVYEIVKE